MHELLPAIRTFWQSACLDKPVRPSCRIVDGRFVLTITGNRERWPELCDLSGVPEYAQREETGDVLTMSWPSLADELFAIDGPIARLKPNYEVRPTQIQMGRLVQRSIEMRDVALIEAGTGTGKGFAYLAIAIMMGRSVVVSTSNKALQRQLMDVDIPFLLEVFGPRNVCLVQGKGNYACMAKASRILAEERSDVPGFGVQVEAKPLAPLLEWYLAEVRNNGAGDMEDITFPLTPRERATLAIDDDCPGQKTCTFGNECFYYRQRAKRQTAQILVTNHALLSLHLYLPAAEILPHTSVIVVDEAHHLAGYARNMLGNELSDVGLRKVCATVEGYLAGLNLSAVVTVRDEISETNYAAKLKITRNETIDRLSGAFQGDVSAWINGRPEKQLGVDPDHVFQTGLRLAAALHLCADYIFDPGQLVADGSDFKRMKAANKIRNAADKIAAFSDSPPKGRTRWIEHNDGNGTVTYKSAPYDVAPFLSGLVGYKTETTIIDLTCCRRCGRKLTAPTVSVLDGMPYGPDCIRYIDVFGDAELVDLATWQTEALEPVRVPARRHATIFTSATLAVPTMEKFTRETGVEGGLSMIVPSPFDYPNNCVLYVPPAASPTPQSPEFTPWMLNEMETLTRASQGGALLLFTSIAAMRLAEQTLGPVFRGLGYECFMQGTRDLDGESLAKGEIIRRFCEHGNAVIFATKSFFEGVSISGLALRLVVLDKLPFAAPNPISQALEGALIEYARDVLKLSGRDAEFYPFNAARVPDMLTNLLQAFGRLIRTNTDWGVVAVLDPRLRSSQYGRQTVLPALPPALLTDNIYRVRDLYAQRNKPIIEAPTPKPRRVVEDFTRI